jgi:hypothetical protein
MNGYDNIAGYSLTTGTADVVVTDSVASYDPIIGNLSNGAQRQYKFQFIDPSFSDQYETGVGTWNSGSSTFSRTTVKTSSNGGAKEDFGAGPKVLFIVNDNEAIQSMGTKVETSTAKVMTGLERAAIVSHTASIAALGDSSTRDVGAVSGTVAAGDDSRFDSVAFDELDAAATLDGTEIVPLQQGTDGVQSTVQDVAGNPMIAYRSHATNLRRGYTDFSKTRIGLFTTATICDLEPWVPTFSGASAVVGQAALIIGSFGFLFTTGTTNAGIASAVSLDGTAQFDVTKSMDFRAYAGVGALPSVEAFNCQIGWCKGAGTLATDGMYFQPSAASANWRAIVKNAAGETDVDTGVLAVIGTFHTFRVHYDSVALSTKFYMDEVLVATTTNATRVNDAIERMTATFSIIKSAGTTGAVLTAKHFSYEIEDSALAGFN